MLEIDAFRQVLGEQGWALLLDAGSVLDGVAWKERDGPLRAASALARRRPDAVGTARAAALELVSSGRRLAEKLGRDEQLLAVREAVEQASAGRVATWHASQVPAGAKVLEIGCGCGGDSLALAHRASNLIATDLDPLRAACAHMNIMALDLPNARAVPEDGLALLAGEAARADVVFADPDRRPGGRRALDPEDWLPPLSALREIARAPTPRRVFVKAASALDADPWLDDFDVTYVSHGGSCVESFLVSIPRDEAGRRGQVTAVQLPDNGPAATLSGARGQASDGLPGTHLLVPDPAAIRAHLLEELCSRYGVHLLDDRIALATGDGALDSPWFKSFRIEHQVPLRVPDVRAALRELGARRLKVHTRGVDFTSPELMHLLRKAVKRKGAGPEVDVFATRAQDRPTAFVTRAVQPA